MTQNPSEQPAGTPLSRSEKWTERMQERPVLISRHQRPKIVMPCDMAWNGLHILRQMLESEGAEVHLLPRYLDIGPLQDEGASKKQAEAIKAAKTEADLTPELKALRDKAAEAHRQMVTDYLAREQPDGVILPGNFYDIPPAEYGSKVVHPTTRLPPPADVRLATENMLFDYALALKEYAHDAKKPIIGVCGGMQLAIARTGGTIIQDLADAGYAPHATPFDATHPTFEELLYNPRAFMLNGLSHPLTEGGVSPQMCIVEPNSILSEAMKATDAHFEEDAPEPDRATPIGCHHHQGTTEELLGKDTPFIVVATAKPQNEAEAHLPPLVEVMELPRTSSNPTTLTHPFAIFVQHHMESGLGRYAPFLLENFVKSCKQTSHKEQTHASLER